jgi:hypothetical protein
MSIRKLIDIEVDRMTGKLKGKIASEFYRFFTDEKQWTWACDVDIGKKNVLRCVTIDPTAKENVLRWGHPGTPVVLDKICKDRYAIIGLCQTKIEKQHIIYISLDGKIIHEEFLGDTIRGLTFEEIGIYGGGWGSCPFGAYGHFDAQDNFIEVIY